MTALLRVRSLGVEFATEDGLVHAVNGVDLDVARGETLAIVGESGSGKSVSMMAVMGLLPLPAARVTADVLELDGRDLLTASAHDVRRLRGSEMAMIFQDPMTALHPLHSIGAQIIEALRFHTSLGRRERRARAVELLDLVGIPSAERRLDEYPHQFSGGMRQRAMIAMALACEPKLLIADEPTTALDVTIQDQIVDLVDGLRAERQMSVIWISHDLGVVAGIADRVVVMYGGRVVEQAGVDDVYERPRHPYTLGLLASLPRLDAEDRSTRLEAIPGSPPDARTVGDWCSFAPRCPHRRPACTTAVPELVEVGDGHRSRCLPEVVEALEAEPAGSGVPA